MSQIVQGAKRIRTITFPNTVRRVMDAAFMYRALRAVVLNEGLEVLESCAFQCSRLEKLRVPATVREMHASAFNSCANLRRVEFEEASALLKIGAWCFQDSGIEDLTLPPSVKEIGAGAFFGCRRLQSV